MTNTNSHYKILDIKTYASTETLANNSKYYCQVFDKITTSYIYCELSFINKKFEIEDWEIELNLKCLNEQNEELCDLDCKQKVDQNKHTVFIREGWGTNSPDMFWTIGTYRWEAYIQNELVATRIFYVESCGKAMSELNNPYFDNPNIRLYEGPDENLELYQRSYKSRFNCSTTRYIWIELSAYTKYFKAEHWPCEIFINIRTSTGQLKGELKSLIMIEPKENYLYINSGWGSDTLGTWSAGRYQLDVIFMNTLITRRYFYVDDKIRKPSLYSRLKYLLFGKL
ncbi:MAG TPA: hypothetical protein VGF79_14615 [Bacteroidia bacterium]